MQNKVHDELFNIYQKYGEPFINFQSTMEDKCIVCVTTFCAKQRACKFKNLLKMQNNMRKNANCNPKYKIILLLLLVLIS